MIITKEQQEAWVSNYIKGKHTQDECIGFIDGVEKVMSVIGSAPQQTMTKEPELILSTGSHFGAQLRAFRIAKGLKQVQVSEKMKCHSTNVMHFEKGDGTFGNGSLTTVFKYARALGYTEIKFKL